MNCDTIHFSPLLGGRPACSIRVSGAPLGKSVHEEQTLAARSFVAEAARGEIGLPAVVVVVQIDEKRHDALAAFRDLFGVVRHLADR